MTSHPLFFLIACVALPCLVHAQLWKRFIEFQSPPGRGPLPDYEIVTGDRRLDWMAGWPTDLQVLILSRAEFRMRLRCYVKPLASDNKIQFVSTCANKANRKTVSESKPTGTINTSTGQLLVAIQFDGSEGATATMSASLAEHMSAFYECSVANRRGQRTSNKVHLLDLRRQVPPEFRPTTLPRLGGGPTTLSCSNGSLAFLSALPVQLEWGFSASDRCAHPRPLREAAPATEWPFQVLANGSLYLPFVPDKARKALQGKYLTCTAAGLPLSCYGRPLAFDSGPDRGPTKLAMLRPVGTEDIKIRASNNVGTRLACNFAAGQGTVQVEWAFKKGDVNAQIKEGYNADRMVTLENGELFFKGVFPDATAGDYTCKVTWQPLTGDKQKQQGTYRVATVDVPRFVTDFKDSVFTEDGGDASLTCTFQRQSEVRPYLSFCGSALDWESVAKAEERMREISNIYSAVMAPLNSTISKARPKAGDLLTYTSRKMVFRAKATQLSSIHPVECIGKKKIDKTIYAVRRQVIISVYPKPVVGRLPQSWNCADCDPCNKRHFYCSLSNTVDLQYAGLELAIDWTLKEKAGRESNITDVEFPEFSVSGMRLTLGRVLDADMAARLQGATVRCSVRLLSGGRTVATPVAGSPPAQVGRVKQCHSCTFLIACSIIVTVVLVVLLLAVVVVVAVVVFLACRRMKQDEGTAAVGFCAAVGLVVCAAVACIMCCGPKETVVQNNPSNSNPPGGDEEEKKPLNEKDTNV